MAPRLRLLVLGGAFLGILHTSVAGADPVTVTSGRFDVVWDDPSGFAFFGPGFELSAGFVRVSSVAQQTCLAGCTPGTKVNLSATAGGASPFSLGTSMSAVINGVVYARPAGPEHFVDLSGTLQFDAPDVVLPGATDAAVRIGVSAPFVLSGQVAGFARGAAAGSAPVFQLLLLGSGTATLHLMRSTDGVYRFPEVTYEVTSAATPEPVVFILLATGLVSLPTCMRRSRAFRRRYTMPS